MPAPECPQQKQVSGGHRVKIAGVIKQKTLKTEIGCTGIALHSGCQNRHDAETGRRKFRHSHLCRTDLFNERREIVVGWQNVVDTRLATTVGDHGATVSTIEHLMAALAGCEIDNVLIEVDDAIPIMDGSSAPFVFLIESAGAGQTVNRTDRDQDFKNRPVDDGTRALTVSPSDEFSLDFEIDFGSSAIDCQERVFERTGENFKSDISRARTFGFEHEVDALHDADPLGGSLDNAVVISGDKVLNKDGLRYDDEFVVTRFWIALATFICRWPGYRCRPGQPVGTYHEQ